MTRNELVNALSDWALREGITSWRDVARGLRIPYRTLQDWRLGKRTPRPLQLAALKRKMGGGYGYVLRSPEGFYVCRETPDIAPGFTPVTRHNSMLDAKEKARRLNAQEGYNTD